MTGEKLAVATLRFTQSLLGFDKPLCWDLVTLQATALAYPGQAAMRNGLLVAKQAAEHGFARLAAKGLAFEGEDRHGLVHRRVELVMVLSKRLNRYVGILGHDCGGERRVGIF